jgi:serine/threonine protein phosphatase PrpC
MCRLNAGCTAVVALKHGDELYVANAGDSRAVLCRGSGEVYPLSFDHKPADVSSCSFLLCFIFYILPD